MRRWVNDFLLGARLAFAGGRNGLVRAGLGALGVALGVALLLLAASVPTMIDERGARGAARVDPMFTGDELMPRSDRTYLVSRVDTTYREVPIRGRLVEAEGPQAPVPPGVAKLPAAGEMVVSPALAELLRSDEGALLRPRLDHRIVGTIDDVGLAGPLELAYYAGADLEAGAAGVVRAERFGEPYTSERLDPVLWLLVIIIFVVLLLPIGVFVAAAVRFGSEHRDRRLAAVRLIGADSGMAHRIAAGEALLNSALGIVLGVVCFLAGRQLIGLVRVQELSVFPADARPAAVPAIMILVTVPAAALVVTLIALRRMVIEPLGVVRRAVGRRRRVWWRLALPVAGIALILPLGRVAPTGSQVNTAQVVTGVVMLLVGITALLPWVVERTVGALGGGFERFGVSWQLAVRRLQLDNTASVRAINGIAVAAAGAVALQMFFFSIEDNYRTGTGADLTRAQIMTTSHSAGATDAAALRSFTGELAAAPGVTGVVAMFESFVHEADAAQHQAALTVADCAALAELAVIDRCADGDVFLAPPPEDLVSGIRMVTPGMTVVLPAGDTWTVPADVRPATGRTNPAGVPEWGILATPGAVDLGTVAVQRTAYVRITPGQRDTLEHLRNTVARRDLRAQVWTLERYQEAGRFDDIRRGLYIGVIAVLLLIGASMVVTGLEQLRDRRRLLAALAAFGTRRSTLSWSVLWQSVIPVALGLALAVVVGVALGALLLRMVGERIVLDWGSIGTVTGAGAGVVLLVTACTLPVLWRLVRPDGLRTE